MRFAPVGLLAMAAMGGISSLRTCEGAGSPGRAGVGFGDAERYHDKSARRLHGA